MNSVKLGFNFPEIIPNQSQKFSTWPQIAKPPNEFHSRIPNWKKAKSFNPRRFHPKKKIHKTHRRFAPYAPLNTTSFLIRAKKSGGIASLESPCPVTPAVLPTPKFSPSRERVGDMAEETWGVNGYGSMNGLIRLRSGGPGEVEEESSGSDLDEHVEVERRLDNGLSRFEMVYPSAEVGPTDDDREAKMERLEEENLTLKERVFLVQREVSELRRRMELLEASNGFVNVNSNVNVNNEDEETTSSNSKMNVNNNVHKDGCVEKPVEVCLKNTSLADCRESNDTPMVA